jgi:C4-dicarboxylate-specific signal transduction histidine kinase
VASGLASVAQGESPEAQLRSIDAEVQQMMAMLASVLGDSRSGGVGYETASIADALNDAIAYVRLVHRTAVVAAPSAQRTLAVQVSATQLRRALSNVLDNAARAAGADGKVVVSVRRHKGAVHLRVDDDGPGFGGVPSEHFVGLRSAAHQLRLLGGRLEIVPSGPLGGARVILVVPEARPAAPARAEQEPSRAHPGL